VKRKWWSTQGWLHNGPWRSTRYPCTPCQGRSLKGVALWNDRELAEAEVAARQKEGSGAPLRIIPWRGSVQI
jgi:hypothetical protein